MNAIRTEQLPAIAMDAWRREARTSPADFERRLGPGHQPGPDRRTLSERLADAVVSAYFAIEADKLFYQKVRGAASRAWLPDGQAGSVLVYEPLVALLGGRGTAGAMLESGLRPAVDIEATLYEPDLVLLVIGGERVSAPDAWFELDGISRVVALRQATTLALMDHGLPRTGEISGLPLEEGSAQSLSSAFRA